MSELQEICSYAKGKTNVSELTLTNYISTENMLPNKSGIVNATSLPTTATTQEYLKNDILVSNIRPYFKKIWYATKKGGCSNDVLVFRAKENIDSKFLYYLLADDAFFEYSMATSKGTKMPRGDKLSIMQYNVPDFDLTTQKQIASILSALDDKIQLNNRINENLEQQAQAIFSNLFPKCMSNGIAMSNIIDVRDGTHDSPKAKKEGYSLITSKHLQAYSVNKKEANLISYEDFNKINERSKVEYGDILISMIGTVGIISFISDKSIDFAIKNVGLFRTSQSAKLRFYVLNYLKTNEVANYIEQHLAGSTQKYISLTELRNLPIRIPSDEDLQEYNELISPIYGQIITLSKENQWLTELRDTLLPKLMNGEIDVSEAKI